MSGIRGDFMSEFVDLFRDRYSTALIADAAYRADMPVRVPTAGLAPLNQQDKIAGPIKTVRANNDLVSIIAAVHQAQAGHIIVIANETYEVALIGDLIGTEAKRKDLAGIIVDGLVRDATELLEINLPVICRGLYPVGPLKLPAELKSHGEIDVEVKVGDAIAYTGDWAFADADGVVFLAKKDLEVTFEWAEKSWRREEALAAEIKGGRALGDIFEIERFLEARNRDPQVNFNQHLAALRKAI
jgi:regulator of RNase E activity RraA